MKIKKHIVDKFLRAQSLRGVSSKTIFRRGQDLKYFRTWLRSKHINRDNLDRFVTHYQRRHMPNTVNSAIGSLKIFCKFLFEEKLIKKELHYYLRAMRVGQRMLLVPTQAEVEAILTCPRTWSRYHSWIDPRKYDIFFAFLARCGMRRGEALSLRIRDINFTTNEIMIFGKGSVIRTICLPQIMRDDLLNWFHDRKVRQNNWVFETRNGTPCGPATFLGELKKRLAILGLDMRITLHTFRRFWITAAVRANMNTIKTMKVVGHTRLETHLRYVALVGEDTRDIMDEHPLNRVPAPEESPSRPQMPHILAKKPDYKVN